MQTILVFLITGNKYFLIVASVLVSCYERRCNCYESAETLIFNFFITKNILV
jgi:hypothetical protein